MMVLPAPEESIILWEKAFSFDLMHIMVKGWVKSPNTDDGKKVAGGAFRSLER
jgi:hypothetical protein